jgi:hypothetical protein
MLFMCVAGHINLFLFSSVKFSYPRCTSVSFYHYSFINICLDVLCVVLQLQFLLCAFTVPWTCAWTSNRDPEGLMYLVSGPQGHKFESFWGININNCLIISILLGLWYSSIWKQVKAEGDMYFTFSIR